MYRKYQLKQTYVVNSHNYLLATQSDEDHPVIFHQILLGNENLPQLMGPKHVQGYIEENQNQNVINQNRQGFQIYFDNNLLQIRLRNGVGFIGQIQEMCFLDVIQLVNSLCLDFAIAVKQIVANTRQGQMESLNNCSKFYAYFLEENGQDVIVPFLEGEGKKIHYYDLHFGKVFGGSSNKQGQYVKIKRIVKNKTIANKNSEEKAFRKFVLFLLSIFSSKNVSEFMKAIEGIKKNNIFSEDIQEWIGNIKQKQIVSLLSKCLNKPEEYNIHIFKKQCQLIAEKYRKKVDQPHTEESLKKKPSFAKPHRPLVSKQQKARLSKSFINPSTKSQQISPVPHQREKQAKRQNSRLKSSKSQISLLKSSSGKFSSNKSTHKFKKTNGSLFKEAKVVPKNTSNIFNQTSKSKLIKNNSSSSTTFDKSINFGNLGSATSNWFNMESTLQSQDLSGKLRNFKRGNHNYTSTHSPAVSQTNKFLQIESKIEEQGNEVNHIRSQVNSLEEQDLRLRAKLKNKSRERFLKKQEMKHEPIEPAEKVLQDQQTMTEVSQKEETKAKNEKKKISKRLITNQFNVSFYDNKKKDEDNPSSPKLQLKKSIMKPELTQDPQQNMQQKPSVLATPVESPLTSKKSSAKFIKDDKISKNTAFSKKMGKQNIHNIYEGQIEDISFKPFPKSQGSLQKEDKTNKNDEEKKVKTQKQTKAEEKNEEAKAQRKEDKQKSKKKTVVQDPQKNFPIKYFQMVLKFFQQNLQTIKDYKKAAKLNCIVNTFYFLTFLTTIQEQEINRYNGLITLIIKKRKAIENKQNMLFLNVNPQDIFNRSHNMLSIDRDISINFDSYAQGKKKVNNIEDIKFFMTLYQQGCILLNTILQQLYKHIQNNKILLLKKNKFVFFLELGHILTVNMILASQKRRYYQNIVKQQYEQLFSRQTFSFKNSEDQYLIQYRKRLSESEINYVNAMQELNKNKNWIQMYT